MVTVCGGGGVSLRPSGDGKHPSFPSSVPPPLPPRARGVQRRAVANTIFTSLESIDDYDSESALSEADSDPQSSQVPTSPKDVRAARDDGNDNDSDSEMDEDELYDHALESLNAGEPKHGLFYISQCLRLNPSRPDRWLVRADCNLDLDRPADAALDCNRSLALDSKDAAMYCRRAQCMQRLRRLEDAIEDAEYAAYLGSAEAQEMLEDLRVQKRIVAALEDKNHYTALDIPHTAGDLDIKRAYKAACMKWHPDRWARAPPTERELAELCFKECNTAHQILADAENRVKYDFYLERRKIDPTLPHPMDAPHHYQYVQHVQQRQQMKQQQWAQPRNQFQSHSAPASQCSSPLSYQSTCASPQWMFGGFPGFPMSPMSPMSPQALRSPSHGLHPYSMFAPRA